MKRVANFLIILIFSIPTYAQKLKATTYDFPKPVDTKSREIQVQKKTIYADTLNQVFATNNFPAARLNDFKLVRGNLYTALIEPENTPVNYSPWFAFKIWAQEDQNIWVHFIYHYAGHRYIPKLSFDGEHWQPIDNTSFTFIEDGSAIMNINVSADTLWVSAQEIMDSQRIGAWCQDLAKDNRVSFSSIGKSKLGRDMYFMDINNGKVKKKDIIAIFSRQHPPEVTGFKAMQSFLDELLTNAR